MLLKCTADGRRIKVNGASAAQSNVARGMKMTMSTSATMSARVHRKVMRAPHKRVLPGKMAHAGKMVHPGKLAHPGKLSHLGKFGKLPHYTHTHTLRPPELCENSNDSGLGPDHDQRHLSSINRLDSEEWDQPGCKRRRDMAVKVECDDANDAYPCPPPHVPPAPALTLPTIRASCSLSSPSTEQSRLAYQETYRSCGKLGSGGKYAGGGKLAGPGGKLSGKLGGKLGGKYGGKLAQALARRRALVSMSPSGPPGLAAPLAGRSRDGTVELQILCQPESQHRARYQTEGSRGAVKDNSGNGFPIVKLVGYDKPAVLQVFIGTDTGRVAPHMFYQACRVSGKNSTTCKERKDDGTVVIEIDLEPTKNWQVTCDCVGILKERNVDVEHRFGELGGPAAHVSRGKKKSTRCRMVFRTEIVNAEGQTETLQVCSTQIICTQPPGVPEVCRKSLVSCPATGGLELYLLGKNFLKETRVVFCHRQDGRTVWEDEVVPDKEFLQQTHLVCCVPPYIRSDIIEPVTVQLFVRSGGKASEPHNFQYTPPAHDTGPQHCTRHHTQGGAGAGEEPRGALAWGAAMLAPRRASAAPEPPLKAEPDDSSQSLPSERDEPPPAPALLPLEGVDLRLKHEACAPFDALKLSPPARQPSPPSPLASFTQQLQAIQTDKMVESVTAAIFNSEDPGGQMYAQPLMAMEPLRRDLKLAGPEPALLAYRAPYNPFTITKLEMETDQIEQRIAQQTAHMEALVEDAMKATAAMLPGDAAAKLDELVNSRAEDHLAGAPGGGAAPPGEPPLCEAPHLVLQAPPPQDELMLMAELPTAVKTPPAAVKSMILNAAAEILTSDSTMNALVTSAINTANILTEVEQPLPSEPAAEAPLSAMSQAVSQAVTQAVSQAVSHAVSQAVSQEMTVPGNGLTGMSDSDLLSYINPSTFDQV